MTDASAALLAAPPEASQNLQAGYGASLGQSNQFEQALGAAQANGTQGLEGASPTGGVDALKPAMKALMGTVESVNGEAADLAQVASSLKAKGGALSPGDMVMLTVRCQEFMFHCDLTSNIANRTSDGLQQLFRQQG